MNFGFFTKTREARRDHDDFSQLIFSVCFDCCSCCNLIPCCPNFRNSERRQPDNCEGICYDFWSCCNLCGLTSNCNDGNNTCIDRACCPNARRGDVLDDIFCCCNCFGLCGTPNDICCCTDDNKYHGAAVYEMTPCYKYFCSCCDQ